MTDSQKQLNDLFTRVHRINHAITYLNWDQMVMMPDKGVEERSRCLAELSSLRHGLLTDPNLSDWFVDAEAAAQDAALELPETASLREMRLQWQASVCVPAELEEAQIIAGAKCEHAWRTQRAANDWTGFLENFEEVVSLARREATLRQAAAPERFETPYDALLDLHCAGDSSAMIGQVFAELKTQLPGLLEKVMTKQNSRDYTVPDGHYPIEKQLELNKSLMNTLGFDFEGGRLDVSMHPFSTGGRGDSRITTRFQENEFIDALQATAHETGHASYEGSLPEEWLHLPVGNSRNMCIHESQSLLFEKQIFLSRAFYRYFVPEIHKCLPGSSSMDADELWQLSTQVRPSYIRVEADEVTYPMHVMLRFDIESALINGSIEASDIPEVWDRAMSDYLGLRTKDNHNMGCLQDIHWTDGAFGYFPSYTLGAINGAQLFATIRQQHTDWQDQLEHGSVEFIRVWLNENIWKKGCFLASQDLMTAATGQGTTASYLVDHLKARYLDEAY